MLYLAFIRGGKLISEKVFAGYKGKTPYLAGSPNYDLCAVAYADALLELLHQTEELEVEPDYLYFSSAASTQAGILLAIKYLQADYRVVGISHGLWEDGNPVNVPSNVAKIANRAAERLNISPQVNPEDVISIDKYTGDSYQDKYGVPHPKVVKAIKIVARNEGILLDPIYSGKAMAVLIDDIKEGRIEQDDTVVFVHTGGAPSLFTYGDQFELDDGIVSTV